MSNGHAEYAPSSMNADLACPARIPFIKTFPTAPADSSNIFADEGSVYHAVAEDVLTEWWNEGCSVDEILDTHNGRKWSQYLKNLPAEYRDTLVDREGLNYVKEYVGHVQDFLQKCKDPELYVETSVMLIEGRCYGTADVIIVDTNDVYVIDLKFGAGVAVSAFENKQALTYLTGAVLDSSVRDTGGQENYHAIIIQPRIPSSEPYSQWTVALKDLQNHLDAIRAMIAEGDSGDARFQEGSHCRWCPVKAVCPQLRAVATGQDLNHPPDRMTAEALAESLEWAKKAEFYIAALREYAHTRIESGATEVPGWKVVDKRATTKWTSEDEAIQWLNDEGMTKDECTTSKLKTPTQVGKLLPKENREKMLELLTHKNSSGTVLVAESDKRESVVKNRSKGQAKARQLAAIALSK